MTQGSYEEEEFDRLQQLFGDRVDSGEHDFTDLGESIIGGRGRPGRVVPVSSFADFPAGAGAANRGARGRSLGTEPKSRVRDRVAPEVWNLVLLTLANAIVAVTAVVSGATVAGLLSCTALSVGTIALAVTHIMRSSGRR